MEDMSYCSFSGGEEFKDHFQPGIYVCSECGHELFRSSSKFQHSSPWPAFSETIREDSVSKQPEAWGPLKVCCGKCGSGLGHEFLHDGPEKCDEPKNKRDLMIVTSLPEWTVDDVFGTKLTQHPGH